jgi:hypothetical protein
MSRLFPPFEKREGWGTLGCGASVEVKGVGQECPTHTSMSEPSRPLYCFALFTAHTWSREEHHQHLPSGQILCCLHNPSNALSPYIRYKDYRTQWAQFQLYTAVS